MDIQLDDEFYAGSNFDKGHLSRREDANYGTTAQLAKRNADLTCIYTNACPQVPALNRSNRSGLWGNLENLVLENGAVKEKGAQAKSPSLTAQYSKASDPVFRGIQIPVEFYKIIVWPTSTKQIRATAFKLSQGHLLDDINLEDLNIDQNITFKEYQCSIAKHHHRQPAQFQGLLPFDHVQSNGQAAGAEVGGGVGRDDGQGLEWGRRSILRLSGIGTGSDVRKCGESHRKAELRLKVEADDK